MIAVDDLATAARELEERYGLPSLEGGRHAGWGTANRIVPLGDTYLELVTVVDRTEAEQSAFGRWIAAANGLAGWVVRTRDLAAVAERLGLLVQRGSRRSLRWRSAGIEQAAAEPVLPFFIEWAPGTQLPGSVHATHSLERLVLDGDDARLNAWLGDHELPIEVRAGRPAVARAQLTGGLSLP